MSNPEVQAEQSIEELVARYFELDDQITQVVKLHAEELAPLKEEQQRIDRRVLDYFNRHDQLLSVPTKAGTAQPKVSTFINVSDWTEFIADVVANNAFQLLKKDVNRTAAEEVFRATGAYPVGTKSTSEKSISYTRPRRRPSKQAV